MNLDLFKRGYFLQAESQDQIIVPYSKTMKFQKKKGIGSKSFDKGKH